MRGSHESINFVKGKPMNCASKGLCVAAQVALAAGVFSVAAGLAQAQDAAVDQAGSTGQPATTEAQNLKGVVVTGSLIRRVDIETASPVITIGRQHIDDSGSVTLGSVLQELPSIAGNAINHDTILLLLGMITSARLSGVFGLGILMWGVPLVVLGLWPSVPLALLCFGVIGLGNILVDVAGLTLLQRTAPDKVRARVFGVWESVFLATIGLGAIIAPLLIHAFGPRGALIAAGGGLSVVALLFWRRLGTVDVPALVPERELALLREIPIFAPLPPVTLEQLASHLSHVSVAAGDIVFRQGEYGDRFYIVERGEVRLTEDQGTRVSLKSDDHYRRKAGARGVVNGGSKEAFVAAMPRPFRDSLPLRLDQYRDQAVQPKEAPDFTYADVQPWLTAEPWLRRPLVQRWKSKARNPAFRAALIAGLASHPEWDPVLFPEKYKGKPSVGPARATRAHPLPAREAAPPSPSAQ